MALTQQDKEELYQYIISRGRGIASLPDGDSDLSNKYLGPVIEYTSGGTAGRLVRLAVSLLQGKGATMRRNGDEVQWKLQGSTDVWETLFTVSSLKGDKGDNGKNLVFRKGETALEYKLEGEEDTAYKTLFTFAEVMPDVSDFSEEGITLLQRPATEAATEVRQTMSTIQSEADAAIQSATDAAEAAQTAAGNVQDGKTPVITIGTVEDGSSAAATMTSAGTDESGNPKSALNLVLPKGNTGPAPILELGEVTTVEPSDPASATFQSNGVDPSGANKYRLALSIPKGKSGQDGTGAGNVLVNNKASLLASKQYAFKPGQDGSVNGAFEEVVASGSKITLDLDGLGEIGNGIFGTELNNYLNKLEIVQKSTTDGTPYQKFKQAIIDNALPIVGKYTLDNKARYAICSNLVIDNFSIALFEETVSITDGIKLEFNYESIKNTILFVNVENEEGALRITSSDGLNMVYLHPNVTSLTSSSTSDEIFSACGGKEILANTCKNLAQGTQLAIGINGMQYYLPHMVTSAYQDDDNFSLYFFLNFNNLEFRLSIAVSAGQASCEVDNLCFAYSDNMDEDGLYVNKITAGEISQSKLSTALAELGVTGSFEIPSALLELTNESTSDEIKAAVGGDVGWDALVQAISDNKILYIIPVEKTAYFIPVYTIEVDPSTSAVMAVLYISMPGAWMQIVLAKQDNIYTINIDNIVDSEVIVMRMGSMLTKEDVDTIKKAMNDHKYLAITVDSSCDSIPAYVETNSDDSSGVNIATFRAYHNTETKVLTFGIDSYEFPREGGNPDMSSVRLTFDLQKYDKNVLNFTNKGDGTKALMDDGQYHNLTEVQDTLTSTSTTAALSANQGRELKNLIDGKVGSTEITTIKKLTQSAYDALSSKDTKTLYACIQTNGTIIIR